MGNYQEALKYHNECRAKQEIVSGKNHPNYATSLSNLGNVLIDMGEYEEALRYNQECLAIR